MKKLSYIILNMAILMSIFSPLVNAIVECPYCPQTRITITQLRQHVSLNHPNQVLPAFEQDYSCPHCPYTSKVSIYEVRQHVGLQHPNQPLPFADQVE